LDKIKNCPFCGGEAYARFVPGSKGAFGYASVECRKCGAVPYVHQAYYLLSKEEATKGVIEAWNRRVNDDN
jgi:Lar family restriction alleviation protein